MNFNYSYRAFLISCLLVGNLVLFLVSIRLSGNTPEEEETYTAVEYSEEFLEEETVIDISEQVKIETNTAYNEAERFISEIENSRNETEENSEENETQDTDSEMDLSDAIALNDAKERLNSVKEKLLENSKTRKKASQSEGANRKSTVSYNLKDRKALRLRNPVYTCEGSGKLVINIEVSDQGKVLKASFNKAASTTSNGCLIDSALDYAYRAKFTTAPGKVKQIGTITYIFPGQD